MKSLIEQGIKSIKRSCTYSRIEFKGTLEEEGTDEVIAIDYTAMTRQGSPVVLSLELPEEEGGRFILWEMNQTHLEEGWYYVTALHKA